MVFDIEVTNLYGETLATVARYQQVKVRAAVSEDRSYSAAMSLYEDAVAELSSTGFSGHKIGALSRMLRIAYRGEPFVWGPITNPKYTTQNGGSVTVVGLGPLGDKMARRQLNYGDDIVGESAGPAPQNPSDYTTMRKVIQAAYDTADQRAINVPDIGIFPGTNSGPVAAAGFWTQIERGANNLDKLDELSKSITGSEWDCPPYLPGAGETPFDAADGVVNVDGAFTFPNSAIGLGQTPADIPVNPGALAALPPHGELVAGIIDGTMIHRDYNLRYTSRTDTEIQGVTGYPALGDFDDGDPITTRYGRRPYHYADFNTYDFMGDDLTASLTFLYDDQDPAASNLRDFDWEPDGDNCRNQNVALMTSSDADKRGIRKIARNVTSWREIGVRSTWDSISGANVVDVSEENVAGHAQAEVERYGRPANYFKAYLKTEPASGTPADPDDPDHIPQYGRDFGLGDRVMARGRKGNMDSSLIAGRIMAVELTQLDSANNVQANLDCVPHQAADGEVTVS